MLERKGRRKRELDGKEERRGTESERVARNSGRVSTKSCPRVGTDSRSHCAMQLEFCTNTETVKSFNDATQTDEALALPANGGSLAHNTQT